MVEKLLGEVLQLVDLLAFIGAQQRITDAQSSLDAARAGLSEAQVMIQDARAKIEVV